MVDLVTLDEVKEHLDKTSTDDDAELMEFIEAATEVVEDYIGSVVSRVYVERQPGGGTVLILDHYPILALTSVVPWLTSGTTYNVADLTFDPVTGIVERLDGGVFTGGPFKVTYPAGRDSVPPNVRMAAKIIIGHMWETQRGRAGSAIGRRLPGGDSEDLAPIPVGMSYAVPRRALELLRRYLRAPVIG